MKAIKCPNCGNKMKAMSAPCKVTILAVDAQWRCPSCNVCGPSARAKNAYLAIRDAARLTREWIARMDADKRLDTHAQAAIDAIRDEVTDSADALTEEYMKWQEKGVPRPRDHAYREGRYHGAALSFKILSEAGFKATEVTHELG